MSLFDKALELIDAGIRGENQGLPIRFKRLVDYVPNVQRATYYLLGGETGSGKTSLADDLFLFTPFDFIMNKPEDRKEEIKVIYFSFEIDSTIKIIKGITRKIYLDHKIIVDSNYILSKGKNRVATEIYELVKTTRDYFDSLEDILDIHDVTMSPSKIDFYLNAYAKRNGTYVNSNGSPYKLGIDDAGKVKYVSNNPNLYTIIFIDHVALTDKEKNVHTTKDIIDTLSKKLVRQRNLHKFIIVMVNQFNRTISSTDRFKLEMVKPQLSDFKDSANTQQDANVILATFSPNRYKIETYGGYNIGLLQDRFRSIDVLKNRDGTPDISLGLAYVGEIGYFNELPQSVKMTTDKYNNTLKSINDKKVVTKDDTDQQQQIF